MAVEDFDVVPERILIPVKGLKVPCVWTVGRVTIHPGEAALELVKDAPPAGEPGGFHEETVSEILQSAEDASIAELPGRPNIEDSIDELRSCLDALRLLQLSRRWTLTSSFGLPGEVHWSLVEYVAVWDRSAAGGRAVGDTEGWTFSKDAYDDWSASPAFEFLSGALADPERDEASRRAVLGVQLLSRAATEHRPDLKMLGVASALEAWLLARSAGPQTLRLVRHVTWFSCVDGDGTPCASPSAPCAYLRLSPGRTEDRKRLMRLRKLGEEFELWRCSDWFRVLDWYAARSEAAHGQPRAVTKKEADEAEFWVAHYLAEPILLWLADHRDDPVGSLESALDGLPEPKGWQEMVEAIDSQSPPPEPPGTI